MSLSPGAQRIKDQYQNQAWTYVNKLEGQLIEAERLLKAIHGLASTARTEGDSSDQCDALGEICERVEAAGLVTGYERGYKNREEKL